MNKGPCSSSPSFSCSSRVLTCCAASFRYIVRHSRLSLPARCSLSRFMTYKTRSRPLLQAKSIQHAERTGRQASVAAMSKAELACRVQAASGQQPQPSMFECLPLAGCQE